MSDRTPEILVGPAADRLLAEPEFLDAWSRLHARCPDATCYQSPGFVGAWYRAYRDRYEPVIVRSTSEGRGLEALWFLAFDPPARQLVHAGAHQAEYHVWLAAPDDAAGFLGSAWPELRRRFRFESLRFRYLPSDSLVPTFGRAPGVLRSAATRPCPRPLIRLRAEEIRASFETKWFKRRLGGLRKLGPFEIRRVKTPAELEAVFDDIIAFYDLRQGAVNGETPFGLDPVKRRFHLALFERAPEGNHLTVSFSNGRPIAALWAARSGTRAHVGILAHSPLYTKYSPGTLHLMLACQTLLEDGVDALDLTPGGDPWKERLANDHDATAEVLLYRSALDRRRAAASEAVAEAGKRLAARFGIPVASLRSAAGWLAPSSLPRRLRAWIGEEREARVYRADRATAAACPADGRLVRDSIPDLLRFEPGGRSPAREGLLSLALARLEAGHSCFSVTIDGRVALTGWMARGPDAVSLVEVDQAISIPEGAAVVYDIRTDAAFRGRGLARAAAGELARLAAAKEGAESVYAVIVSEDPASPGEIESLGFRYEGALRRRRRWGREMKSADPIPSLAEAPT